MCNNARSFIMAARLKELRQKKGLSHAKLSKELEEKRGVKISKDALIAYEAPEFHTRAGTNEGMSVRNLRGLAEFYEVSTDYLLGYADEATPHMDERAASEYLGISTAALRKWKYYIYPAIELEPAERYTFSPLELVGGLLADEHFYACIDEICTGITTIKKSLEFPRLHELDEETAEELLNAIDFIEAHGYDALELDRIGRAEATAAAASLHNYLQDIINTEYEAAKERDIEWLRDIRKARRKWEIEEANNAET